MEANPFIGGIVERAAPAKPKDIIAPKGPQRTGFPVPPIRPLKQQNSIEPSLPDFRVSTGLTSSTRSVEGASESANLTQDENMRYVISMSEGERLAAERDLMEKISPESLELLRSLALKKFGNQMCDLVGTAVRSTEQQQTETSETKTKRTKKVVFEAGHITAATSDANVKTKSASTIVSNNNNNPPSTTVKTRSSADIFNLSGCKVISRADAIRLFTKAIGESSFLGEWGLDDGDMNEIAVFAVDLLFKVNFAAEELVDDDMVSSEAISRIATSAKVAEDSDDDDEELDDGVSGYTFVEISEYFRSENASQRLLAAQILQGVLRRRDDATALEAYGNDHTIFGDDVTGGDIISVETRAISTGDYAAAYKIITDFISKKVADTLQQSQRQEDAAGDLRTYNTPSERARLHRVVTFAMMTLCAGELPTELPTLILWILQRPRLSPTMALGVLSCMKAYVSCQWEEVAAEKLWGRLWGAQGTPSLPVPHARRSELSYEEHISDCAEKRSKAVVDEEEEEGAGADGQGQGRDRKQQQQGGLKAPQASSVYEAFALRCRWGRVDNLVQESSAVEILCGYISTGADLVGIVNSTKSTAGRRAAAAFASTANGSGKVTGSNSITAEYVKDPASRLALLSSLCSIEILQTLCRQSNNIPRGTTADASASSSVDIIAREIGTIWARCMPFLDSDVMFPIEFPEASSSSQSNKKNSNKNNSNIGERLCCAWWRLTAELCRKSGAFATAINNSFDITSKAMILLLKHPSSSLASSPSSVSSPLLSQDTAGGGGAILWALRAWRVCLAYGYGMDSVIELLLVMTQTTATAGGTTNNLSSSPVDVTESVNSRRTKIQHDIGNAVAPGLLRCIGANSSSSSNTEERLLEVLWILEQTALTAAAVLDASIAELSSLIQQISSSNSATTKKVVAFATADDADSRSHDDNGTNQKKKTKKYPRAQTEKAIQTAKALLGPCERLLEYILILTNTDTLVGDDGSSRLMTASMHFVASFVGVCVRPNTTGSSVSTAGVEISSAIGSARPVSTTSAASVNNNSSSIINNNAADDDDAADVISVLNQISPLCALRSFKTQSLSQSLSLSDELSAPAAHLAQACLTYASLLRQLSASSIQEKLLHNSNSTTATATPTKETREDGRSVEEEKQKETDDDLKDPAKRTKIIEAQVGLKDIFDLHIADAAAVYRLEASVCSLLEQFASSTKRIYTLYDLSATPDASASSLNQHHLSHVELSLASQRLLVSAASYADSTILTGDLSADICRSVQERQSSIYCTGTVTAVSEGLISWHLHRLTQAQAVQGLQLICSLTRANNDLFPTLIATALTLLPSLGQGFRKTLRALAKVVVDVICLRPAMLHCSGGGDGGISGAVVSPSETAAVVDVNESLRQRVLTFILGPPSKAAIIHPVDSYAETGVVLNFADGLEISAERRSEKDRGAAAAAVAAIPIVHPSLCDWQAEKFDSKVPLSRIWPLKCLTQLRGPAFGMWLKTLYLFENGSNNNNKVTGGVAVAGVGGRVSLTTGVALSEKLYALVKVCFPEHAFRWLSRELPNGVIPTEGELADVSQTSVDAFLQLLGIYVDELSRGNALYVDGFTAAAQSDTSPTQGLLARASAPLQLRTQQLSLQSQSSSSTGRTDRLFSQSSRAAAGVNEVCAKLLDAATGQYIDTNIHAAALVLILSPRISPWKVQERVWRQLAELRLLHLLEEETVLAASFPLLSIVESPDTLANSNSSSSLQQLIVSPIVARSIVAALTSLRSDEDANWMIVSLGIYLISSSIFTTQGSTASNDSSSGGSECSAGIAAAASPVVVVRSSSAGRFLKELICGGPSAQSAPSWLLLGIVLAASSALQVHKPSADAAVSDDAITIGTPAAVWRWSSSDFIHFHNTRLLLSACTTAADNAGSSQQHCSHDHAVPVVGLEVRAVMETKVAEEYLRDLIEEFRPDLQDMFTSLPQSI